MINLCIELCITNVLIELDAKIMVDMLHKNKEISNTNDVILVDCKEGLQKIPRVQIQHCYREANKCADALGRRGALLSQDFVIFQSPQLMWHCWLALMLWALCMSIFAPLFLFCS